MLALKSAQNDIETIDYQGSTLTLARWPEASRNE